MFNFLVAQNERAPDPRVGSNPALGGTYDSLSIAVVIGFLIILIHCCCYLPAFSTACNSSVQKLFPQAALTVAPTMVGPTSEILNTPATFVVVGFGTVLGGAAILMLSNI